MSSLSLNPFQRTWMYLSTIFGAIGLVNVAEDVHNWAPFFMQLIAHYKAIWYFLFSWIPIYVPDWIKDYTFFGVLMLSSLLRAIRIPRGIVFLIFLLISALWPLFLIIIVTSMFVDPDRYGDYIITSLLAGDNDYKQNQEMRADFLRILQVLGSIFLLFFVFLTISIVITGDV